MRYARVPALVPVALLVSVSSFALAGDTNPPAGPVGPTMKTLEQVEPRVVINDLPGGATGLHVISEPGIYYLTRSVVGQAGKNGIEISPSVPGDFIIELNGFQLIGAPGTLDAVHGIGVTGGTGEGRIVIRGISPAISGWGGDGVDVSGFDSVEVSKMDISSCAGLGVRVSSASTPAGRAVLKDLTITGCGLGGGVIEGRTVVGVERLEASGCGGPGVGVSASAGGYLEIKLEKCRVTSCVAPGAVSIDASQSVGATIRVSETSCSDNTGHGIHVLSTNHPPTTVVAHEIGHSFSVNNGGDGVRIEIDGSASHSVHCFSSTTSGNGGDGLFCGGAVLVTDDISLASFTSTDNGGSGLNVSGSLGVRGATLSGNGGDGLRFVAPGEPVGGINVSLEQIVGRDNQGTGSTFDWRPLGGPYSMSIASSSFVGNGLDGFYSQDNNQHTGVIDISECVASGNTLAGFVIDNDPPAAGTEPKSKGRVRKGMAGGNVGGSGFSITHCLFEASWSGASDNSVDGFTVVGTSCDLDSCSAERNAGHGFSALANDAGFGSCRASGNGGDGFAVVPLGGAGSVVFDRCESSGNTGAGARATGCPPFMPFKCAGLSCLSNGAGGLVVAGSGRVSISGGDFSSNTGDGISVEVSDTFSVSGATACGNSGHGIVHASAVGVPAGFVGAEGCVCSGNALAGISISDSAGGRVERCAAYANAGVGIEVLSFAHVVAGNMCGNNTGGNISVLLPGNAMGTVVDETTIGTEDNTTANFVP